MAPRRKKPSPPPVAEREPPVSITGCTLIGVQKAAVETQVRAVEALGRAAEANAKAIERAAQALEIKFSGPLMSIGSTEGIRFGAGTTTLDGGGIKLGPD